MLKCALHSLGCKVNSYETQAMQRLMEEAGYEIVPFGNDPADVYIINTCSVTNIADHKSRQMIHKARGLNPDAVVIVTGCYIESAGEKLDTEDIDVVIGNNDKSRLLVLLKEHYLRIGDSAAAERLEMVLGKSCCNISVTDKSNNTFDEMRLDMPLEHTRAYIKVQDGCNRFCTYCIIPYVRGRIRSRNMDSVIEEVTRVALNGCKEIVLTGIHLSSYGLDGKNESGDEGYSDSSLITLIEQLNKVGPLMRIRLGSLEPRIITEDFARRLAACDKICPHFHLSLQSGSDSVLHRMNRKYTSDEFYESVCILRKYFDDPAITTDVIVGFPGESEEEFEETAAFLEKVRFYELHVFKYSRRAGTPADKMPGQLSNADKEVRSRRLIDMDARLSEQYRRSYIGKTVKVLLEDTQIIDNKKYICGFTDTYVRVCLPYDESLKSGDLIDVTLDEIVSRNIMLGHPAQ